LDQVDIYAKAIVIVFLITDSSSLNIVEGSMSAYKACKSRVDAVQQALNETFKD